jgi:predicted transcriptional regulator
MAMPLWNRKQKQLVPVEADQLGPLEKEVVDILWARGRSSVRDVVQDLSRPLAYTTVMTTLDRLFKKGFLVREKSERAFFYQPVHSRTEWEQRRAGLWLSRFLATNDSSGEMLVTCLVEAVGQHDEALLDELERQISLKRQQLDGAKENE